METQERLLKDFYLAFEDRFRGSAEDIAQRLSVYLPYLSPIPEAQKPIVDIGCGRGEWLELLKANGYAALGVDMDSAMIAHCRKSGLDVVEGDALDYLRSLEPDSVRGVSAFHLVEHVPFAVTLELLREIRRVLTAGGMAIIETPNPHNILVGACHFYNDPTHLRPIPSPLLSFAAEYCGLSSPQVLFLHPADFSHWIREQNITLEFRFNDLFYGPQDYSLIAYKR
ncbi:MAG: class I SAM-dependent methyltransferase [Candidatus Eremiobacteraeota bacterium]|nr:class I SAM-dependent methyltransferase [Candidatus Eremiobacteraeota bacterium]